VTDSPTAVYDVTLPSSSEVAVSDCDSTDYLTSFKNIPYYHPVVTCGETVSRSGVEVMEMSHLNNGSDLVNYLY
jgi:hypothetical protein